MVGWLSFDIYACFCPLRKLRALGVWERYHAWMRLTWVAHSRDRWQAGRLWTLARSCSCTGCYIAHQGHRVEWCRRSCSKECIVTACLSYGLGLNQLKHVKTYRTTFGKMNIDSPAILMFTRGAVFSQMCFLMSRFAVFRRKLVREAELLKCPWETRLDTKVREWECSAFRTW